MFYDVSADTAQLVIKHASCLVLLLSVPQVFQLNHIIPSVSSLVHVRKVMCPSTEIRSTLPSIFTNV